MSTRVKQQRIAKNGGDMAIEQTIASDDSLLPAPAEFAAYKEVDPAIVGWLLEQTKKEQEHRHKTEDDKIKLMNKALNTDRIVLVFILCLILVFILLCAIFVYLGKDVYGSIFGVCGLIGAIVVYRQFTKKPQG